MGQDSPTLTHWGAFRVATDQGRLRTVRPLPDDGEPSAIGQSLLDTHDHPLRITRPMVRAGYLAGKRGATDRRGQEPFVPVDWPTALSLVGDALQRVRREHGPAAIFGGSYGWASAGRFHFAPAQLHRFLGLFGGFTGSRGTYSSGAAEVLLPHVLMPLRQLQAEAPGWAEVAAHGQLVVAFGGLALKNTQVNFGGVTRHGAHDAMKRCAAAGVRFVSLSPLRDDMPDDIGAEWVPLRPGSDTAVMLALAYVLIDERLVDTDFLSRCCTGFDRLKAYVRGTDDGTPKTPAWAAALSGVAATRIEALARDMAARRTLLTVSWSVQRAERGEQPVWMAVALAAMAGSLGRRGGGIAVGQNAMHSLGNGGAAIPFAALPMPRNPAASFIPVARLADMLLHPGGSYSFDGERRRYPDIRLVYWAGGNPFHHHQDIGRLIRAWARPETVIVHEAFWTPTARRADIVLPCATSLERNDIGVGAGDSAIVAMKQAPLPPGEARSDFAILADLAARLGFGPDFTQGLDEKGWLRSLYEASVPRLRARGVALPAFDDFWAAERIDLPPAPPTPPPCAGLRADADAHPLTTPSGKVELWSDRLAGFGYADCAGHPTWTAPTEWLGGARAIRFPLHLVSNQPASRLHSQLDFGRTSLAGKRGGREPCRLNPADATARGIADGDTVRLCNDRGACFSVAVLSAAVMPGVVQLATGAWYDPLDPGDPTSPCRHGNPNVLTRDAGTSSLAQATTAHSCLVEVARVPAGEAPPAAPHRPPPFAT